MINKERAAAARKQAAQQAAAEARLTGLEVERQGYVRRGDTERVDEVDAEISRYRKVAGHETAAAEKAAAEKAEADRAAAEKAAAEKAEADRAAAEKAAAEGNQNDGAGDSPASPDAGDATSQATPSRRGRARAAAKADEAGKGDETKSEG